MEGLYNGLFLHVVLYNGHCHKIVEEGGRMIYFPDAGQMKAADRYTIDVLGIPSLELMERAAESCVQIMEAEGIDLSKICVICGSGNNGGDGFAIARMLKEKKLDVELVFIGKEVSCTEETRRQMQLFQKVGGRISNTYEEKEYSVIVDAIFGVGLSRPIEGKYFEIIESLNRSKAVRVAVDIPSGISADTGCVMGTAVRADLTVTFQKRKLGLIFYPGCEYAGRVFIADIGICTEKMEEDAETVFSYEPSLFSELLPERKPDSHKGTYGKVLIIAGSKGMAGAAYLNALSAYRTGAGLVQIYTVEENRMILQQLLPEAIITAYDSYDEEEVRGLLTWADVVCIGSGIGVNECSEKILEMVVKNVQVPCVVDADGLNILAGHPQYLEGISAGQFVFTPHLKEMSRLTRIDVETLKSRRIDAARAFAEKYPVVCVMKDARTVVACAGRQTYVNISGNAAMAKAGSGDVLAGIITGLLAQGKDCFEGACIGVLLHGIAGDAAKVEKGSYSVLARELADGIAAVLSRKED